MDNNISSIDNTNSPKNIMISSLEITSHWS